MRKKAAFNFKSIMSVVSKPVESKQRSVLYVRDEYNETYLQFSRQNKHKKLQAIEEFLYISIKTNLHLSCYKEHKTLFHAIVFWLRAPERFDWVEYSYHI